MLNHITVMGRLTRDPELRCTQSGTPVASFPLLATGTIRTRLPASVPPTSSTLWPGAPLGSS